jgi:ABC-type transport system involved in multi-copper enzyme maturation permease subunit
MRLVQAEFLKHYRRTGFVLATIGVTVLPALMMQALDDARYEDLFGVLALLVVVAGIMVGSSLGTSDESSGVFRELVATGRPRLDLFAARVPAGLVLVLASAMAGYVVLAAGEGLVLAHAGWLALVAAVSFALSLGVAALVGSAAQSISILLALWLVVTPLVQSAESLEWLRDGLVITGLDRIMPASLSEGEPLHWLSLGGAITVLLAWTVVPLLAGAWRTMTRDA